MEPDHEVTLVKQLIFGALEQCRVEYSNRIGGYDNRDSEFEITDFTAYENCDGPLVLYTSEGHTFEVNLRQIDPHRRKSSIPLSPI